MAALRHTETSEPRSPNSTSGRQLPAPVLFTLPKVEGIQTTPVAAKIVSQESKTTALAQPKVQSSPSERTRRNTRSIVFFCGLLFVGYIVYQAKTKNNDAVKETLAAQGISEGELIPNVELPTGESTKAPNTTLVSAQSDQDSAIDNSDPSTEETIIGSEADTNTSLLAESKGAAESDELGNPFSDETGARVEASSLLLSGNTDSEENGAIASTTNDPPSLTDDGSFEPEIGLISSAGPTGAPQSGDFLLGSSSSPQTNFSSGASTTPTLTETAAAESDIEVLLAAWRRSRGEVTQQTTGPVSSTTPEFTNPLVPPASPGYQTNVPNGSNTQNASTGSGLPPYQPVQLDYSQFSNQNSGTGALTMPPQESRQPYVPISPSLTNGGLGG